MGRGIAGFARVASIATAAAGAGIATARRAEPDDHAIPRLGAVDAINAACRARTYPAQAIAIACDALNEVRSGGTQALTRYQDRERRGRDPMTTVDFMRPGEVPARLRLAARLLTHGRRVWPPMQASCPKPSRGPSPGVVYAIWTPGVSAVAPAPVAEPVAIPDDHTGSEAATLPPAAQSVTSFTSLRS